VEIVLVARYSENPHAYTHTHTQTHTHTHTHTHTSTHTHTAIYLLDAHYEVYIWLGWWPDQKNKLLREVNATTGSAHSRWLRDKKLALETALLYVKGTHQLVLFIAHR